MKIGLLTLPFNNNYGGYLQAYALMTILKQMGHNVELIYRRHNRRHLLFRLKYVAITVIKLLIGHSRGPILPNQELEHRNRGVNMMSFVDKHISPKTKPLYSTPELTKECKGKYDAIIVGSDQVWRPDYVPNIENYFLDFVRDEKIIKVAYAASFGNCCPNYTYIERKICGELLGRFDAVSVREESGIDVIDKFRWNVARKPIVVLDPTMLLDRQHYKSLVTSKCVDEKYILSYVLDASENANMLTKQLCRELNLKEYRIIDSSKKGKPGYTCPSIETWLEGFMNAEHVITDSFHGAVFSILFNKPFVVCVNKDRGADRFYTLLRHFDLENRIWNENKDILLCSLAPIDWDRVNRILCDMRNNSIAYIDSLLKYTKQR